jgi:hypothetical protein
VGAAREAQDRAGEAFQGVKGSAEDAARRGREMADGARGGIEEAARGAADKGREVAEDVREGGETLGEKAKVGERGSAWFWGDLRRFRGVVGERVVRV